MPNSIILGKQPAGSLVPVGLGAPINGGNITFSPGKPHLGGKEGAIIWCAADQTTELMRLDAQGLHLFGQLIPKEKVIELLQQLHQKACTCPTQQILQQGCICGGA